MLRVRVDAHEGLLRLGPSAVERVPAQLRLGFLFEHRLEEGVFGRVHEGHRIQPEQGRDRQGEAGDSEHQASAQAPLRSFRRGAHGVASSSLSSLKPTPCTVRSIGRANGLSSACRNRYRCERSGSDCGGKEDVYLNAYKYSIAYYYYRIATLPTPNATENRLLEATLKKAESLVRDCLQVGPSSSYAGRNADDAAIANADVGANLVAGGDDGAAPDGKIKLAQSNLPQ